MKWQVQLPCDDESPRAARSAVRGWLTRRVASDLVADVELIISELVTNSVLSGPDQPITVVLDVESPTRVSGEVSDAGDVWASIDAIGQRGLFEQGMGLPIVIAIATEWGVYDGSSHFWFAVER
jgi:anti-sigma regulatory factor (Ser/Thr protein kinase)